MWPKNRDAKCEAKLTELKKNKKKKYNYSWRLKHPFQNIDRATKQNSQRK